MKQPPVPRLSKFVIDGETIDLDYLLTTEFEEVAEAAEKLPGAIAWLNWKRADASEQVDISERQFKEEEARQYFELRNGAFEERNYGGKMTDKAVALAVRLEQSVINKAREWEIWRAHLLRITGQIEALQAKLDLVRTSEATRRRLITTPPTDTEIEQLGEEQTETDPEDTR